MNIDNVDFSSMSDLDLKLMSSKIDATIKALSAKRDLLKAEILERHKDSIAKLYDEKGTPFGYDCEADILRSRGVAEPL